MSSPTTCVRCARPLAVESAAGLCPECERTLHSPGSTPRDRMPFSPGVSSFDPTLDESPAPALGAQTLTHSTGAGAATALTGPDRVPLPVAPAGYEILEELGLGGMGAVYLAREVVPDRLVAMKFLRRAGSQSAYDRFLVEVRALAVLDHPHIIRVLATDFFRADPFFTTEYFPRGSLLKKVEADGPIEAHEAARLMAIVARAVHGANEKGVIHRDLKPSNILLTEDGTPKVADFGLAKRLEQDDELTITAGALGSPPYMAPEQTGKLRDGRITARTDVYGLGATLYHIVTEKRPFAGDTADDVITQVLNEMPSAPRSLRADVPRELEAIILMCLEKEPSRRYGSALALAEDLELFLAGRIPKAPLLTWPRRVGQRLRRIRKETVLVAVALVLLGVALYLALRPPPPGNEKPPDTRDAVQRFLDDSHANLASGKAVKLVGETGPPLYHRWRLGPGEIRQVNKDNPCFQIFARGYGFLEIFPNPRIDRYVLSGELQHVEAAGKLDKKPVPMLHTVGFYVAHDEQPGPDEGRIHTFGIVKFCDYLDPEATVAQLFHRDLLLFERPLRPTINLEHPVASARRDRVEKLPGPWRRFKITVTPDGMDVSDGAALVRYKTKLPTRAEAFQAWSDQNTPGVRISDWSSLRPMGIWVYGSCVAVRNVTLTPLPPP